jgi:hypothetical protein
MFEYIYENRDSTILFILLVITFLLTMVSMVYDMISRKQITDETIANKNAQLMIFKGVFGIISNIFIFYYIWTHKTIYTKTNLNRFVNFTILIIIINIITFYYNMADITDGWLWLYIKEKTNNLKYIFIQRYTEPLFYFLLFFLSIIKYNVY